MWDAPGQDPGGGSDLPPSSGHELSDLKDQFEQQKVLIAQLKEMIRKSGEPSSVTQEKVDEYMNTLSRHSAKSKKLNKSTTDEDQTRKTADIPASQRISLLRQQVEENKLRLAERGKSQKGIEEMVTQLQAQLDDSQHLISQNSLNISLQDTSTKLEYSENSTSQELYTILLSKEKRITDLLGKVQKLETSVIDLQENVKEKDSVIDARTKAITLMTENLSRKGKTTLDALDDTKEQMRKMQENFVALEAEMKARQMKLLDDLKSKNYEIAELQETNVKLSNENEALNEENVKLRQQLENNDEIKVLQERIKELELVENKSEPASSSNNSPQRTGSGRRKGKNKGKQQQTQSIQSDSSKNEIETLSTTIKSLNEEIDQWKAKEADYEAKIKDLTQELFVLKSKEVDVGENDELAKLKKQLDESNKSMIKVKAQNKSKIKELQKKIDEFKKISDANSEIVRLETENCKLSQKLAELEEEKGSLQLKIVECDSSKVSEREKELQEQIEDHQRDLEEKDKIISILEADITKAKTEIETLSEQLNSLSHLENAQVSTEMASIQFEEQMDSLQNEKKHLQQVNETFEKERDELLERINDLKKEKHDLSTKLEHYIQENIELIDKLEKLSAEKVSSAESIEIVEGLTQQEKLELEAYQKNLDMMAGNLKTSEENLPQADLNESVNELREETSELLQKIELFTVERREVMDKMEDLRQENNALNLKLKEIENNRDVLVETYEQLQTEKELVDEKLEAALKMNNELQQQEKSDVAQMDSIQKYIVEINELKAEIDGYKVRIDEKEADLDSLAHMVKELQDKCEDEEREKSHLSNNLIDINRTLAEMEVDYTKLQQRVQELEEHNNSLSELLEKSQEELETATNAEWEHQRLIEAKNNEIEKLQNLIESHQQTIREKDEHIQNVQADLKQKYESLQKKLRENSDNMQGMKPLEAKIEELNVKNKEQLDKMKKIAANLKKKTQAYQELEGKMKSEQEKWEKEASEKDKQALDQAEHLQNEITSLKQLFDAKSCEYNQLVHDFDQYRDEKCTELRKFEEKNAELQSTLQDLRVRADKANEMNLQQELIQTHEPIEELNAAQMANASQTKIQQLEMIIETQESEIVQYKERIAKLEEGLSFVEERRLSLERKANELGAELEEKSVTCDEMSQAEDMLEKRLQALAAHDEAIEKKLAETLDDNKDLQQRNQKLSEKCEKFKRKLAQTLEKLKEVDGQQTIVGEIENENAEMKKQLTVLENELKHSQAEYGRILEESKSDLERLNNDWQQQFDVVLQEKNELTIKCEKLMEQIAEQSEKIEEANEIKLKLDANQAETRNYEEQIQKFHAENQELKHQLNEKVDKPVVEQQNASLSSYFDNVVPSEEIIAIDYKEQYERINAEKSLLEEEIRNLRLELNDKNHMTNSNNLSLQSANNLSSFFEQPLFDRSSTEIDELKEKIAHLQQELENQRQQHEKNPEIVNPPAVVPSTMWQNEETDPFAFVANSNEAIIVPQQQQQTQSAPTISGNTEEELLNKIKTLEFMLYSVEKEKDDALLQCHELTNELTRLVYKNENLSQNQIVNLESQILNANETQVDGNELKTIEFEKTRPTALSSLEGGAVSEEFIQPKTAYVCTENDEQQHSASLPSNLNAIESQIVSNFEPSPQETQQLHQLEFEPTLPPISSTDGRPVHEPSMTTQDAYLCFGENDDGWGCSPEEAKLEEDYVQNLEGAAAQLPLDEMRAKIHRLESERDSHLEENKQMQVKISKLVKKLKELKVKNEQLTSEKKANVEAGADFFNLDDTIQEELKLQIQQIEKKLKETKNELDKEKSEKASILKRIDVLTSANERMVEMKEKQDVELLGWQQNCRELQGKLQQFEWGDDGFNSNNAATAQNDVVEQDKSPTKENPSELLQKIDELNETIRELSLDNEELQTLLEEQRNLRLNAEKAKATEVIADNMKTESEFLQVVREKETLQDEINNSLEEKKRLQDQVNNLIKTNAELLEKFAKIETESQQLQMAISEKDETISQINNTNFVLAQEKAQVMDLLKNMETEKEQLLQNQSTLNSNAERIQQLMQEKEILFQELQTRNIQVSTMQENVNSDMTQLKIDLEHEIEKAEKLLKENQQLCAAVEEKDSEISRLNVEIANKTQEMTSVIEQLNQEWELRVDQRGTDVAESWKLHLETRETEFGELETRLRKEIDELEAKSNALVNENNELRKNVDAEIRNEVDRVAALQQQINDRQTMINELSQQLQEKQTQLDGIQGECALIKTTMDENCRLIAELRALFAVDDDQVKLSDEIKMQIERRDDNERQVEELRQQLDVLNANFAHMQEESNKKLANLSDVEAKAEEYRVQLETLKDNHVLLQQNLADQSHTIANLTGTLQQVQNLKDYENENTQNLQHNISELQRTNNEVNQQLMEKINEVEKYERMINEKDGEILRYSQLLEEKEREYTYALENLNQENKIALNEEIQKVDVMKKRLLDNENHYEELLAAKQSEIETLNLQLNELKEQQNEILRYENVIREKDGEISVLRAKIEENEVDLNEMRGLIEEKTMEIEKLQNSYYEKSNDLDALIAEMDMSKLQQVQSDTTVASATATTASKVEDELDDDDLSQPVRRAELDLALYIIHQRDMRCEELTIELTQLLEERDTLQLRLSNALREKEEIVRKYKIDELPASSSLEGNQISESSGAVPKHQQQQEKIDVQSNLDPLATKLSELKATGYRKDKTIVDEQELRRFQQLSIMQQHRDDAAKLPAEAAARLVDASYTLSRDVQSPSKVLLNWLWGRSTPKVNNI